MIETIHFTQAYTRHNINIPLYTNRVIYIQDLPIQGFHYDSVFICYSFRNANNIVSSAGRINLSNLEVEDNIVLFRDQNDIPYAIEIPEDSTEGYFYIEDIDGNLFNFSLVISDNPQFI